MPEISNSQIYNCYQQVYLNISYIDRYKRKKKGLILISVNSST